MIASSNRGGIKPDYSNDRARRPDTSNVQQENSDRQKPKQVMRYRTPATVYTGVNRVVAMAPALKPSLK